MKIPISLSLLGLAVLASAQAIPGFKPHVAYSVPGTSMIAMADVNGDGKPDIVSANGYAPNIFNPGFGGHGLTLLLGNGDGTFKTPTAISTVGNPLYVVIADFDGDGIPDLVTDDGLGTTTISFFKGRGDGTFLPPTQTVVAEGPMTQGADLFANGTLIAADFNRDGRPDLAMCYNIVATGPTGDFLEAHTKVLLNNGTGVFTTGFSFAQSTVGTGNQPFVADFNKDGIPDLLVTGFPNMLMLGNGNGTFTQDTTNYYATAPIGDGVTLADFNKDGNLDMVGVGVRGGGRAGPLQFFVNLVLGISGTPFETPLPGYSGAFPGNAVVADFNGDGLPDFATSTLVAYALGDGTYRGVQQADDFGLSVPQLSFTSPFPQEWLIAADLDGNGSQDLIASESASFVEVALNASGNPPLLALLNPSNSAVVSGATVNESVSLGAKAPVGGAVVNLLSSSPAAVVPASVTIPAGSQTVNFLIKATPVTAGTNAVITATYRNVSMKSNVLVVPAYSLSAVSVSPTSIFGLLGGIQP